MKNKLLKQSILLDQSCILSYIGYSEPLAKIQLVEEIDRHIIDKELIYNEKLREINSLEEIKIIIKDILENNVDRKLNESYKRFQAISKSNKDTELISLVALEIIDKTSFLVNLTRKERREYIQQLLEERNKIFFPKDKDQKEERLFSIALGFHKTIIELESNLLKGNKIIKDKELTIKSNKLEKIKITLEDGLLTIKNDFDKPIAFVYLGYIIDSDSSHKFFINFRGSDFKAKSIASYLLEDYVNMKKLYNKINTALDYIIPLLQEQTKYTYISGHSLGGAMACLYLDDHKDSKKKKYRACVFGAPTGRHLQQRLIDQYYEVATIDVNKLWPRFSGLFNLMEKFTDKLNLKPYAGLMINVFSIGETIKEGVSYIKNTAIGKEREDVRQQINYQKMLDEKIQIAQVDKRDFSGEYIEPRLIMVNGDKDPVPIVGGYVYNGLLAIKIHQKEHSIVNYYINLHKDDIRNTQSNNIQAQNNTTMNQNMGINNNDLINKLKKYNKIIDKQKRLNAQHNNKHKKIN